MLHIYICNIYIYLSLFRPTYAPPIPQNAAVTYEIEVLSVKEGPNSSVLTPSARIAFG